MMKILLITICALTSNFLIAQQWYDVAVPTTNKLNDIDFPSSSVGYIVGDSATFLKSIDGGENWIQLPLTGITINPWSSNIIDVNFVSESIGFIVLDNANEGPFKTIDGGLTWTLFSNSQSNMCYKKTMFVNSENNFFIGGAGCFQSGQIENYIDPTWNYSTVNYESFNTNEYVVKMDFNNGVGIAAMNGHYFFRSTDDGATWDTIPSGLSGASFLTSVMFASADTVYAGYDDGTGGGFTLLISTDAGLTWGGDNGTGTFFYPAFLSLGQASNGDVYVGGVTGSVYSGIIFEKSNGSAWWTGTVEQAINGIDSYGIDVTFAVGDSGYVIVNTVLSTLGTSNEDYLNTVNVFPNPTNDFITIDIKLNKSIVYNLVGMNGQTVMANIEVANKKVIDISMLPSGIYYLKPSDKLYHKTHKIIKL